MTGVYLGAQAGYSWAAGSEAVPIAEAIYPVMVPIGVQPELADYAPQFSSGTLYPLYDMITGMSMACEIIVPLWQQPTIATVPPAYAKLLRGGAMTESEGASEYVYTSGAVGFATDDVVGSCIPFNLKLNVDQLLYPLVSNAIVNPTFELVAPGIPILRAQIIGQRPTGSPVDTALVTKLYPRMPVGTAITMTLARQAAVVTGDASAVGTTTLTDAQATFLSSGVQPGDVVTNVDDGSTGGGVVTAVTSETTLNHTALTGGSGNDWQSADDYSIAAGSIPVQRCTSMILPLGNDINPQPGVGGTNAYHEPRITSRSQAIYTMEIQMPVRSDFDWDREIITGKGDPTRYIQFTVTHNQNGIAGSVLSFTFHAKPTRLISKRIGNDGTLFATVQFQQRYDSGLLSLTVS